MRTVAGSRKGMCPTAARPAVQKEDRTQHQSLQPEPHRSPPPPGNTSRAPATASKRSRDADDAAKIAKLSQDVEWGYTLQLPKRLQRKVTARLHREWD